MPYFTEDPLTQVYKALRSYLLADQYVKALILDRNFIDLTGTALDPIKDQVADADLPEIMMMPASAPAPIGRTNTECGIAQTYSLRVVSGQILVKQKFFPVVFALFRAIRRLEQGPASQLLKLDFVQRADQLDRNDNFSSAADEVRGTPGWVATFGIQVRMLFTNQQLDIIK